MYKKALFLFRRDLRLDDNTALREACTSAETVVLGFVFDPRQTDTTKNEYFSEQGFAFLAQSLAELEKEIADQGGKLFFFSGESHQVVASLIEDDGIDAVFLNRDYTPFARARDEAIQKRATKGGVSTVLCDDYTLSPVIDIKTDSGKPYSVFTPFFKKASSFEVHEPIKNIATNFFSGKIKTAHSELQDHQTFLNKKLTLPPGRSAGLRALEGLANLRNYAVSRDLLAEYGTSQLSPHHKYGTVSIRETHHAMKRHHFDTAQFIAELYWRDFYFHIAYHFPFVFTKSFLPWAEHLAWVNDEIQFQAWKEGRTGVPVVDAGMRQMNKTGWMHNRARMIVASFLTKNLLIDWRWGEKYFASRLVDYDPASNNGGWQWSASVGADPRPLRIFNPYTQAQKYDPDACYIKRWVPELGTVDSALLTDGKERDFSVLAPEYARPIVSCRETYHRAREVYAQAKRYE
ncbi:MAG: deoxyribodipyrimidine photo-lyase [Patescibacteria group bacterium]